MFTDRQVQCRVLSQGSRARWLLAATAMAGMLIGFTPVMQVHAAGFVVDSNGDQDDANTGDGICQAATGKCTLRAAIEQANASAGPDTITFSLGTATISPATELPHITDGGTVIRGDGTITLDGGTLTSGGSGLEIDSGSGSKIQGLTIQNFPGAGIVILGAKSTANVIGVDGDGITDDDHERNVIGKNTTGIYIGQGGSNVVAGNYVGVTAAGNAAKPNQSGILIVQSDSNLIGTNADGVSDAAERNVISGNVSTLMYSGGGVEITGGQFNVISGNYIGTNAAGTAAIPNDNGVAIILLSALTANNVIGVTGTSRNGAAQANVISGNNQIGVFLDGTSNDVAGNLIGLRANGTQALGNGAAGVVVSGRGGHRIGTNADGVVDDLERNVISGNGAAGVDINQGTGNIVAGNYIGTDITGLAAVPNQGRGVQIEAGAGGNQIGVNAGGAAKLAERNVISGNNGDGVGVLGGEYNTVGGNYIGVDATGSGKLPNKGAGIDINGANNTAVGWHTPQFTGSSANVIAFNTGPGVEVIGKASINNQLLYNAIFSNGKLGIDLEADGITPNDPSDPDEGANHLANFPNLVQAISNGSLIEVDGKISDGQPKMTVLVQFFASDACDPSGNGEGQRYLGEATYDLSQLGTSFPFHQVFPVAVAPGSFVTLTGTWYDNGIDLNTSEFSECMKVVQGTPKR